MHFSFGYRNSRHALRKGDSTVTSRRVTVMETLHFYVFYIDDEQRVLSGGRSRDRCSVCSASFIRVPPCHRSRQPPKGAAYSQAQHETLS